MLRMSLLARCEWPTGVLAMLLVHGVAWEQACYHNALFFFSSASHFNIQSRGSAGRSVNMSAVNLWSNSCMHGA